ncbi:MAG: PD-(D/E)XK nuclease domain-containing protein, partial [Succinivibrionaceae bacterium]|nr:PD-(D/E)XK nuclease domain-containing protein [Succinivibrionaceae bacterium]
EVKKILKNFNLEEHFEEYKAWYDGYLFGNDEIYCPWDVLNYTSDLIENPNSHPQAYWNNSSENRLAMYAFDNNPNDYAEEFRTLLDGKSIVAPYYESMNYKMIMNVDSNDENYLWTILYMTGYLTKDKNQEGVEEGNVRLRIPNICVKACLEDQIKWTFSMKNPMFKMLSLEYIECFKNDDYGEFQALLNDSLMAYVSIYDTQKGTDKEALYHAYLNGALSTSLKNLRAKYKSNNELGIGRPDIRFILKNPKLRENKCVIIECKVTEKEENLSHYAELAIEQIKEKYFNGIKPSFPNVNCIAMYGIAFYKKTCMINFKKIPI